MVVQSTKQSIANVNTHTPFFKSSVSEHQSLCGKNVSTIDHSHLQRVSRVFGDLANSWDQKSEYIANTIGNTGRLKQVLSEILPTAASILEVGSGTGKIARFILDHSPTIDLVVNDLSEEMCDQLENRFQDMPNVKVVCGPIEDPTLNFSNNSFDLIVLSQVIHHVADQNHVLKRIAGLVRPGGNIVILTVGEGYHANIWPMTGRDDPLGRKSVTEWLRVLEQQTLTIESVFCDEFYQLFSSAQNYFKFMNSIGSLSKTLGYEEVIGASASAFPELLRSLEKVRCLRTKLYFVEGQYVTLKYRRAVQ